MVLIVPGNLSLQERIGAFVVCDFFISQESDQAVLESAEAAFDFAFCLRIGSHAMSHTQGRKGALELRVGVQAVGGGSVTKERQAVCVEAGRSTVLLQEEAKMSKVRPSGIGNSKSAPEDFARVVIDRKNEAGIIF